jgi:hypothetical protein
MKNYLGHLVNEQRPPTVLNVIQRQPVDQHDVLHHQHSPEGAASAVESGQAAAAAPLLSPLVDGTAADLDRLSAQLRDKTRDLLAANLSQTKYFFKKLKKYIDFLSAPSETVAECRQVGVN